MNGWNYGYGNPVNLVDPSGYAPNEPGIQEGRYSYTCNCGWVDWGHAKPTAARQLLSKVYFDPVNVPLPYLDTYKVIHVGMYRLIGGVGRYAVVRKWMSPSDERKVALGIFRELTEEFENWQANAFRGIEEHFLHSSFAEEDLASNLIGFYIAALDPLYRVPESGKNPGNPIETDEELITIVSKPCQSMNADDSMQVFKEYGEFIKSENLGKTEIGALLFY